jgi:thiol-disulfide isomerase/thioredoxin
VYNFIGESIMKLFKTLAVALFFGLTMISANGFAAGKDYSEADFNKTLESGAAVVLDFHASWCPTCRAQAKAFESLMKEEKLAGVTIYEVDFDNSDDLKRKYGVMKQSTLILFKDKKEIDRNMGVKDLGELRVFLSKGLQ